MAKKPTPHYYIWKWGPRQYKWELRAANGKVVADSTTFYRSRSEALTAIRQLEDLVESGPDCRTD